MADKFTRDDDDPMTGAADERLRGVGDDAAEFDDADELDDADDAEDEEEGSTF